MQKETVNQKAHGMLPKREIKSSAPAESMRWIRRAIRCEKTRRGRRVQQAEAIEFRAVEGPTPPQKQAPDWGPEGLEYRVGLCQASDAEPGKGCLDSGPLLGAEERATMRASAIAPACVIGCPPDSCIHSLKAAEDRQGPAGTRKDQEGQ